MLFKVENSTDFSSLGFGSVRLRGPGFSVVAINWQEVFVQISKPFVKSATTYNLEVMKPPDYAKMSEMQKVSRNEARIECLVEGCQLAAIVTRRAIEVDIR